MKIAALTRALSLIFLLGLSNTCFAQDWGKAMESSTAPTDYQAILDRNLALYNSSSSKTNYNNLISYEQILTQKINSQQTVLQLSPAISGPNVGENTLVGTILSELKLGNLNLVTLSRILTSPNYNSTDAHILIILVLKSNLSVNQKEAMIKAIGKLH